MSLWGWICILLCVAPSFICVSVCALRGCLLPVPVSVPICSFVWLPLWLFVCGSVSPMRRILCKHTRVSEREKKDVTLTLSPRYSSAEKFYFILFSFFLSFFLSLSLSLSSPSHPFTYLPTYAISLSYLPILSYLFTYLCYQSFLPTYTILPIYLPMLSVFHSVHLSSPVVSSFSLSFRLSKLFFPSDEAALARMSNIIITLRGKIEFEDTHNDDDDDVFVR